MSHRPSHTGKPSGRPNHLNWDGFDRVYSPKGRCAAKCHICLEVLANTGKLRLEKHRTRCQMLHHGRDIRVRKTTAELDEVNTWIDNADQEWDGYRQSELPNSDGMYYAQCKGCLGVVDAMADDMRQHKESCGGKFAEKEIIFSIESCNDEGDADGDAESSLAGDREEASGEEENYEEEPLPPVAKKPKVYYTPKPRPEYSSMPLPTVALPSPPHRQFSSTAAAAVGSGPCEKCKTRVSKFEEAARVWAMKLDDLPLEQALGIEKKMSDMLFEAIITNLQTKNTLAKRDQH